MSVGFTEFGFYFLPLLACCSLLRARWLLAVAFVASVLQSPAVLLISVGETKFGVTPFNAVSLFVAIHLAGLIVGQKHIYLGIGGLRIALLAWVLFVAVSVVGAFVLPHLFAGLPVYLLAVPNGFDHELTPLRFTLVNVVQAVNSCINLMLFVYILNLRERAAVFQTCLWGLGLALLVSSGVGLYQRLAWFGLVSQPNEFWASNPSYAQVWQTPFARIQRVSFPFVEPSFASAWFAASTGGFLSLIFFGTRWWWLGVFGGGVSAAALLNTLGFTGILALVGFATALFACVFVAIAVDWKRQRATLAYRSCVLLAGLLLCGLLGNTALKLTDQKPIVTKVWSELNAKVSEVVDTGVRARSNRQALLIARDSYGLGVGSGSNRASNYFLSLLTNTGLAGTLAFLLAVAIPWVGVARSRAVGTDPKVFVLGATACMLLCVAGGIPDQNWPPLWIVLLTLFCAYARQFPAPEKVQT